MIDKNTTQPPRVLRLIIISASIAVVGGILLIGIPGALVLELIGWTYIRVGISTLALAGDSVWPIAIMISLLWPTAITPLSLLYYKKFPYQSVFSRWLFSLFGSLLLTVMITFLMLL